MDAMEGTPKKQCRVLVELPGGRTDVVLVFPSAKDITRDALLQRVGHKLQASRKAKASLVHAPFVVREVLRGTTLNRPGSTTGNPGNRDLVLRKDLPPPQAWLVPELRISLPRLRGRGSCARRCSSTKSMGTEIT